VVAWELGKNLSSSLLTWDSNLGAIRPRGPFSHEFDATSRGNGVDGISDGEGSRRESSHGSER
jgi:uncharacterized radical SAM superfamily protein